MAARDNRIKYISQFSGTSATVIITNEAALLWTDSRYHIQAERQIDKKVWTLMKEGLSGTPTIPEWLLDKLPPNSRVGIDNFLIKASDFRKLNDQLRAKKHTLVAIRDNFVDLVWGNARPEPRLKDLEIVNEEFSGIYIIFGSMYRVLDYLNQRKTFQIQFKGKTIGEKIDQIRQDLLKMNAECHVVSALDEIACK